MLDGARQGVLEHLECGVLVGIVDGGGVQLGQLETRQIELTGPCPVVAPECRQLGVELGDPRPRRAAAGSRSTPPKASRAARWLAGDSRRWWACWPWRSTRFGRHVGKRRRRGRAAVDVRPRPSFGGDDAAEDDLMAVVVADEPGVDARLGGAGPNDHWIGPPTDDEFQGLDEHRLAGTGLAGDRRQAVGEDEIDGVDDPEVLDVQLAEHRSHLPEATGRSARTSA